tara:strand:+ start:888 stop:2201 length:1314 start_codon:yes stop_codon:yes gene_type:complete
MSSFFRTVLKSYINPNASFHYPFENKINIPQAKDYKKNRSSWVNNQNKKNIRDLTSNGLRKLLLQSQKYVLTDDFLKNMFKANRKDIEGWSRESIKPPYENMWIEFTSNPLRKSADYTKTLKERGITTDNHGYHINLYARTKETKIYLITPYRTNLYVPNLQKELYPTIKVLAPLHSILFSTDIALTDAEYWDDTNFGNFPSEVSQATKYGTRNKIMKPKDYSSTIERCLWGEDNYKILQDLDESIKDYVAVRPSTFGWYYKSPSSLNMMQNGEYENPVSNINGQWKTTSYAKGLEEMGATTQNWTAEIHFEEQFEELKNAHRLQFHKGISVVLAILVQMNEVHNVREVKYQGNTLGESHKIKEFHEFKTLTIDPSIKSISDYRKRFEPHHNNKYHSVRGHWRHYKTGKKTWIESHHRGDESLGIIEKEYNVVRRKQ